MKQFSGEIRDRLTRRSTIQQTISRSDVGEAVEAEASDEDGRQGSPDYFGSLLKRGNDETDQENSTKEEGKGTQIDFEV